MSVDPPRRVFRRKRRFQGASWTPPSMSADPEDGLWCRQCRKRHGYMYMKVAFEKYHDVWTTLWTCPVNGTVLGETSAHPKG